MLARLTGSETDSQMVHLPVFSALITKAGFSSASTEPAHVPNI